MRIELSADLAGWHAALTPTVDEPGQVFLGLGPETGPCRFYRAVLES